MDTWPGLCTVLTGLLPDPAHLASSRAQESGLPVQGPVRPFTRPFTKALSGEAVYTGSSGHLWRPHAATPQSWQVAELAQPRQDPGPPLDGPEGPGLAGASGMACGWPHWPGHPASPGLVSLPVGAGTPPAHPRKTPVKDRERPLLSRARQPWPPGCLSPWAQGLPQEKGWESGDGQLRLDGWQEGHGGNLSRHPQGLTSAEQGLPLPAWGAQGCSC